MVPGLELATRLILEMCGGEASEVSLAGEIPAPPPAIDFDPAYVKRLAGLELPREPYTDDPGDARLRARGPGPSRVQPPSWRRDVEGKADLVEEVARIAGYDALPAEPLPPLPRVRPAAC